MHSIRSMRALIALLSLTLATGLRSVAVTPGVSDALIDRAVAGLRRAGT